MNVKAVYLECEKKLIALLKMKKLNSKKLKSVLQSLFQFISVFKINVFYYSFFKMI